MSNVQSLEKIVEPRLQVYVEGDFDTLSDRGLPEGSVFKAAEHRAMLLETLETPVTLVVIPEEGALRLIASLRRTFRTFQKRWVEALICDCAKFEEVEEKIIVISSSVKAEHQISIIKDLFLGYLQAERAVSRLLSADEINLVDGDSGVLLPVDVSSYKIVHGHERPRLKCYDYKAFSSTPLTVEATPYYPHHFTIRNGVLEKYKGAGGDIIVPAGVTEIGYKAFDWREDITSIHIPDSVIKINSSAFEFCKGLTELKLPDCVKSIGSDAFGWCENLKYIRLPDQLESIGSSAFHDCISLKEIQVPKNVTDIEWNTFSKCSSLESVSLSSRVEHIGNYAFSGCTALKSICIPKGVISIGGNTFDGCSSLEHIEMYESVKKIDSQAFTGTALYQNQTNWSDDVLYIGTALIKAKECLRGEYSVKDDTTVIASGAFSGCSQLTGIDIPVSVTVIDDSTFQGCSSLSRVTLPTGLTKISGWAFSGCGALNQLELPIGLKTIGDYAFSTGLSSNAWSMHELCLPQGCALEKDCFDYKVKKVLRLNADFFAVPEKLPAHYAEFFPMADPEPHAVAMCLLYQTGKTWQESLKDAIATLDKSAVITEMTKIVAERQEEPSAAVLAAFTLEHLDALGFAEMQQVYSTLKKGNFRALKKLVLNGDFQTKWMENLSSEAKESAITAKKVKPLPLKDFQIENGVLIKYLGTKTEVVIPEGIEAIGDSAFKERDKIRSVIIPEGVKSIGEDAFYGCRKLINVEIPKSTTHFGKRAFVFCSSLNSVTIPGSAEAISFGMFGYCDSLKELVICNGVKRIEYGAFIFCKNLTSVTIPESMTSIGEWAFQDCSGLTHVNLPKELNTIDEGAFICCNNLADKDGFVIVNDVLFDYIPKSQWLADVVIPESVTRISCRVFQDCSCVKSVSIPTSVKSIGESAFRNCNNLRKIAIPESVTSIGKWAFLGCDKLSDVVVPENLSMETLKEAHLYKALDESSMAELIKQEKTWDKDVRDQFFRSYRLSDTRTAMMLAEKRKELDKYAGMRLITVDELRDRYLSNLGLDMKGCKTYDLGHMTVTAHMNRDFSFTVEMPDGNTAYSLPKKGADAEKFKAANKDFTQIKKDSRKIWKNRADLLLGDFITGKERSVEYWIKTYGSNPILHGVACLLVWQQGDKTFLRTDDGFITANNVSYELTKAPIFLAHPIEMNKEELETWQKYFTSHGLKQPFAQIWERAYDPEMITEDRYAGCPILFFQLQGAEKHGFNEDLNIPGCRIERVWTSEAAQNGNKVSYCDIRSFKIEKFSRAVNHALAYLDQVTIEGRIKKDDADVMRNVEGSNLAQVTNYIRMAQANKAVNVLALLMEYKNNRFPEADPMAEFTLE